MSERPVVVIGGGVTGLATAHFLRREAEAAGRSLRTVVVERATRAGGQILTRRRDGFLLEAGPDAIVAEKPAARRLVDEVGLGDDVVPSNDALGGLAIAWKGGLVDLPPGHPLLPARLRDVFRSPLLGLSAKLRYAVEPWVPRRHSPHDESVASFVRRRLGRQVLERLGEPFLAHTHAGRPERMSLVATYPRLRALEERHGSLRRGVRAMASRAGSRPRGSRFWTLRGGLAELPRRLAEELGEHLLLGREVVHLTDGPEDQPASRWTVTLDDGRVLDAAAVVLAVPAAVAASLLSRLLPEGATLLRQLRAVPIATVSLAFRAGALDRPPRGFGFLVPRSEPLRILGATWSSRKFPGRVPEGSVLTRAFVGGTGDGDRLEGTDSDLIDLVRGDLEPLLGAREAPVLTEVARFPDGYPQADVGHRERIREIEARLPDRLRVAGSPYHGVGLPDCVESAERTATAIWNELSRARSG